MGLGKRIGLIVPSSNVVMEPEFSRMAPSTGVSVHSTRVPLPRGDRDYLGRIVDAIPEAAWQLSHAKVDVLALGCTASSFMGGLATEERILCELRQHAPVGATTPITAVVEALRRLGAGRVVTASPYDEALDLEETAFLQARGLAVLGVGRLPFYDPQAPANEEEIVDCVVALKRGHPKAQAVFITCTDLPTLDLIPALESQLGLPVVSSNQATAWHCLRLLGLRSEGAFGMLVSR